MGKSHESPYHLHKSQPYPSLLEHLLQQVATPVEALADTIRQGLEMALFPSADTGRLASIRLAIPHKDFLDPKHRQHQFV